MMTAPVSEETMAMKTASASAARLKEMPRNPGIMNRAFAPLSAPGTSASEQPREMRIRPRAHRFRARLEILPSRGRIKAPPKGIKTAMSTASLDPTSSPAICEI
jgi:hypothetical protein